MDTPALDILLRNLRLPAILSTYQELAQRAAAEHWGYAQYLHALIEEEAEARQKRRIQRLIKQSGLPAGKTFSVLKKGLLAPKVRTMLPALSSGEFVHQAQNILMFGLPGRGKTHLAAAIGHELIMRHGIPVLFTRTFSLVQRLLTAKAELRIEREFAKLDKFDVIILDDIGYVQQNRDEMEILFTFLAERYERKSLIVTSNLVFSQWDRIFKDPMTTAAAIDRLIHHSIILEMTGDSVRTMKPEIVAG